MELIRLGAERVNEIVVKSFENKITDFSIRVDELVSVKNIRFNISTEFEQELVITMFSSDTKEVPFIALDKGKYSNSNIMSIEICFTKSDEVKFNEEIIMLKNVLPGIMLGIIK